MRTFDYTTIPASLQAPAVTNLLLEIREHKGCQAYWRVTAPRALESLRESARVQSVTSSNRIEGIVTTAQRIDGIVRHNLAPHTRAEEEIAGYRDVLALIHEQHDYIRVTPGVILQLHRELMRHTATSYGGRWKDSDTEIVTRDPDGTMTVRFRPTPALLTPDAVEQLCATYRRGIELESCDPLLLALRFSFDFVSIHPFTDGNGRMSRLLTVLLMERSDYDVGRYVSIESLIEHTKDQYYNALAASSRGWEHGENDEAPIVQYLLGVVLAAYRELEEKLAPFAQGHATSQDRVRAVFNRRIGKVTKAMVMEDCPDISEVTIKRALASLVRQGAIEKVGGGRSTGYVRVP